VAKSVFGDFWQSVKDAGTGYNPFNKGDDAYPKRTKFDKSRYQNSPDQGTAPVTENPDLPAAGADAVKNPKKPYDPNNPELN
jgi:hypothetical protein